MALRALFVCAANRLRSPTAERIFAGRFGVIETRSRGLSQRARRRLRAADVAWADVILVMEDAHLDRLLEDFGEHVGDTPIHVLDIPDEHRYMDPELCAALEDAAGAILERAAAERGR
ncbi:MAG: phosphotyrosine protein phosphatase [Myxococcales bacterium]|nr:phosphotyrosine protein phosphatase [Myxococcales bacterium]